MWDPRADHAQGPVDEPVVMALIEQQHVPEQREDDAKADEVDEEDEEDDSQRGAPVRGRAHARIRHAQPTT